MCEALGALDDAEAFYRKALENDLAWAKAEPDESRPREFLRDHDFPQMVKILVRRGKRVEARQTQAQFLRLVDEWDQKAITDTERNAVTAAYVSVGMQWHRLGDYARSRESFRKALDGLTRQLQATPNNSEAREKVGEAHEWLADISMNLGLVWEARLHGRQTVELRSRNHWPPTDPMTAENLYYALCWEAEPAFATGDIGLALKSLEAIWGTLDAAGGRKASEFTELYDDLVHRHAYVLLTVGEPDRAAAMLADRLAAWRGRVGAAAQEADKDAARLQLLLGRVQLQRGSVPEARAKLRDALGQYRALADRAPDDSEHATNLAAAHRALSAAAIAGDEWATAASHLDDAINTPAPLAEAGRLSPVPLRDLDRELRAACRVARAGLPMVDDVLRRPPAEVRPLLALRAAALARRGDHWGAVAAAEALHKLGPHDPAVQADLARCYAAMVQATGRRSAVAALARTLYAGRAVAALAGAARAGGADLGQWLTDSALDPVRPDPRFRALVEALDAACFIPVPFVRPAVR